MGQNDTRTDPVRVEHEHIAQHNLAAWSAGLPAIRALNTAGIMPIVLKSLPEIEELYGDVGARSTNDVDLLVRADELLEAYRSLLQAGFTVKRGRDYADLDEETDLIGFQQALGGRKWTLLSPGQDPVDIDLHNDAMAHWRSPALRSDIWQRVRPRERDGVRFLVLGREDRLIFHCWELVEEGFKGKKLRDLRQSLHHSKNVDWHFIYRHSRELGLSLTVRLACDVAADPTDIAPRPWHWSTDAGQLKMRIVTKFIRGGTVPLRGPVARIIRITIADRPLHTWVPAARQWMAPPRPRDPVTGHGLVSRSVYARQCLKLWRRRAADLYTYLSRRRP